MPASPKLQAVIDTATSLDAAKTDAADKADKLSQAQAADATAKDTVAQATDAFNVAVEALKS